MKSPFTAPVLLGALLTVFPVRASGTNDSGSTEKPELGYFLGGGGGFQSGIGLHGGVKYGLSIYQIGAGIIFRNELLWYSLGARYLRNIVEGRALDTYVWGGTSVMGRKDTKAEENNQSLQSYEDEGEEDTRLFTVGGGAGLTFHFGLPIHLSVDSGLQYHHDRSGGREPDISLLPTINASLTYHW